MSARPRWSRLTSNHLAIVLLALFGVYIYRDLWPLATFTKHPIDNSEGWLLWAKAIVLFIISIIVPLFMPRQYTPVDPEEPAPIPAPEQTASIISLVLWFFLDPIVFKAYRIPHLSHDQLPPIADYDQGKNLVKTGFPHLDPFTGSKKRHIFFGLMHVYRMLQFCVFFAPRLTMLFRRRVYYTSLYASASGPGITCKSYRHQSAIEVSRDARRRCCCEALGLDHLAVLGTNLWDLGHAMVYFHRCKQISLSLM